MSGASFYLVMLVSFGSEEPWFVRVKVAMVIEPWCSVSSRVPVGA